MANPVRIYVLHHPDSTLAADLTNRIYDWFRLPSLEGIPVYIRSYPGVNGDQPPLPASEGADANVLEYLIPLVDAHMVRDPLWHEYLAELATKCQESGLGEERTGGWVMFPVSLDSSAFNLPRVITNRNFIRHGLGAGIAKDDSARKAVAAEEMLKHLTEAIARDLNARIFPHQAGSRFKIFISYSRADNTAVAKELRDYIQGETQCQVFLDENDIAYGGAFENALQENVEDYARAMIVISGDNYADRPWCRWEIRKFTTPRLLPLVPSKPRSGKHIHFFNPLLVLDAVAGPQMTRVLPELSQAPMVRWEAGRAKLCFSVLMREALLGLRDVLVARRVLAEDNLQSAVVVNRLPGPLGIQEILRKRKERGRLSQIRTIHYPGNGLPLIELRLLRKTFDGLRFRAFRDILRESASELSSEFVRESADSPKMREQLESVEIQPIGTRLPLRGKVIAVSTSYAERDLASVGYLPQHQDEALIHMLRPLVRMGADVLYGGYPPSVHECTLQTASWSAKRNITATLVRILSDERLEESDEDDRSQVDGNGHRPERGSLVFNISAWPRCERITPVQEAAWINTCRILRVLPQEAGLEPWSQSLPCDGDEPPGFRRHVALTMSAMRRRLATGYTCRVPGDGDCTIQPAAFIFMGGKLTEFSGVMPGIMEEFVHAAATKRPIFLIGGLGGAAGVIARALSSPGGAARPAEFTVDHYYGPRQPSTADYRALIVELEAAGDPHPQKLFDELWALISDCRSGGLDCLFANGLTDAENRELIGTTNTLKAVQLVWKGLGQAAER